MKKDKHEEEEAEKRLITRRQALKYMAAGGLGIVGAYYGLTRSQIIDFLDKDAAESDSENRIPVTTRIDKKTGAAISLLGFGCMRFPVLEPGKPEIDEELSMKMIDYAYRRGINYYDTAYPYHGGLSETFTGKALKRYPRETFYLADKMPGWAVRKPEDAPRIFEEQLQKCQVEYFDYYLLHALGNRKDYERIYEEYGVLEYLKQQKAEGRIRSLGFSFHGDLEFFKYLLDKDEEWDFVQIQYNYYDYDDKRQMSGTLNRLLDERGIQSIIMEPVRGGMLATLNKGTVEMLKKAEPKRSVASWAIRYAGTPRNVLTVLSGMSLLEHVVDNIATMSPLKPVSEEEEILLNKVVTAYKANRPIPCTECRYCMPCPYGVDIPGIFMAYNKCTGDLNMPDPNEPFDDEFKRKRRALLVTYNNTVEKSGQAHHCIGCNKCVEHCPQRIKIPQRLDEIEKLVKTVKERSV